MAIEKNGFHKPIPYRLIIMAVLLIALISLQIAAAQIRSLWEDEAYTGWLITTKPSVFIEVLKADVNNNPPLYWVSVYVWSKVVGTSDFELRSFSILWLIATSLLTYRIAKDLLDKNVALVATALLTFSPLVLTYAHNARYYSMAATFTLLLFYMFLKYLHSNSFFHLVLYVLAGTGLLYTLYMGATVLLAVNIWWFIQWNRGNHKSTRLLAWALAQGLILILYAPWISTLITTMQQNLPSTLGGVSWLMGTILRVGYLGYTFGVGEFLSPLNPISWLGMVLVAGLILFAFMKGKTDFWLPAISLVVTGIISVGFSLIAVYPQSAWQNLSSRTYFVYPFFLMLLAYGIIQIKGNWKWGLLIILLMIYGVGIHNYFTDREAIKPILIVPWRTIMTDIQKKSNPDAVVICSDNDFACSYYLARYGFEPYSTGDWERISSKNPTEIWWIQSNLSNSGNLPDMNTKTLVILQNQYQETAVLNYAPQDSGISMIKTKYLGYQPYQYRVVVSRFILH
jgi:mannosyltransferase